MRKRLSAILVPLAIIGLVGFAVIVVNQSFQLVELAGRMHPIAGDVVFWCIIAIFGFCIAVPLFALLTLPAPLVPPELGEGPEYEKHLARLKKRLARNPHVEGAPAEIVEVEAALRQLDLVADYRTKVAAS